MQSNSCLGHGEREARKSKINKLSVSPLENPEENLMVPVSVEMSLKELEEKFASKPEWKLIEDGGVLSIPVEEFRKGKKGTRIENYTVGQTIEKLNSLILTKYNEEKKKCKAAGKSEAEAEKLAAAAAYKLPLLKAVHDWQDVEAEIKLKGEVKSFFYSTIGSELGKLRQVSIGNFHRNDQKLDKSSF